MDTASSPVEHPRILVVYGKELVSYVFGDEHPLQPSRYTLTMSLLSSLGWLERSDVDMEPPRTASLDDLLLAHSYPYVQAVMCAQNMVEGESERIDLSRYGLGTADNPLFPFMHDAAALYTGATIQAMRAIVDARAVHAYSPAGGQHHAMRERASGFCIYNDCAAAIAAATAAGHRVAYVDLDAHHGDGVQTAFYGDPRVLTISLHESGRFLFPGTGWPYETGEGEGIGYAVNVALPPGTRDSHWLRAFHAVALPLIRAYRPSVLVTQHGADSHTLDPLTDLLLSVDGHRASYKALHRLAHEVTGGRWIALGGGGYETVQVVPRSWTQLIAIAAGRSLAGATPTAWRDYVHDRAGAKAPTMFTDRMSTEYRPWEGGEGDPASRIDQEINKTRQALFPLHGLDPDRSEY